MDPRFATVPQKVWRHVAPSLAIEPPKPKGGRPRVPDHVVLAGIVYRLRTGCQWHALPREFGTGSTCHARFQQWAAAGVCRRFSLAALRHYDRRRGVQWEWTALDEVIVKAPRGETRRGGIRPIGASSA